MIPDNTSDCKLNDLLGRLDGVKPRRDGWQARCPAHGDRTPSLSINVRDERILVNCFAGCRPEAVVSAIGLSMADLFLSRGAAAMPFRAVNSKAPNPRPAPAAKPAAEKPTPEFWEAQYDSFLNHPKREAGLRCYADKLGVTASSLRALGCCWVAERILGCCWVADRSGTYVCPEPEVENGLLCWPMRDSEGTVVGLGTRNRLGKKLYDGGSSLGLVYAPDWGESGSAVYLCEGLSGAAAFRTMGLCAIGRPSNTTGVPDLIRLLEGETREIVVVADRDDRKDPTGQIVSPGKEGGLSTARKLADALRVPVRVVLPPDGKKDSRDWLKSQKPDLTSAEALAELRRRFVAGLEVVEVCRPSVDPFEVEVGAEPPPATRTDPPESRPAAPAKPRCRPEERCLSPRGSLMEYIGRKSRPQDSVWRTRCNRGSCPGCLAFRKANRREEADGAIDKAAKTSDTLYVIRAPQESYQARKKAIKRQAAKDGCRAGGYTVWSRGEVVIVTAVAVADALAEAEPRGKGRPMARAWGTWFTRAKKEEPQYRKVGSVYRTTAQVREVCESLGAEVVEKLPMEGGSVLHVADVILPSGNPGLRRKVIEAILSVPSVREAAPHTVGTDKTPSAAHDLRQFDDDFGDWLALTG
jgi:hypothetical protein